LRSSTSGRRGVAASRLGLSAIGPSVGERRTAPFYRGAAGAAILLGCRASATLMRQAAAATVSRPRAGGRQQNDGAGFQPSTGLRQGQLSDWRRPFARRARRSRNPRRARGGARSFFRRARIAPDRSGGEETRESEGEAILRPSRRMDCFRIVARERAEKTPARASARPSIPSRCRSSRRLTSVGIVCVKPG